MSRAAEGQFIPREQLRRDLERERAGCRAERFAIQENGSHTDADEPGGVADVERPRPAEPSGVEGAAATRPGRGPEALQSDAVGGHGGGPANVTFTAYAQCHITAAAVHPNTSGATSGRAAVTGTSASTPSPIQ